MQLYHGGVTDNQVPEYMTRQEAAAVLGLTVDDIDRMISHGLLARYRIRGRYVRVRVRDVEQLLDVPRDWLRRC